MVKHYERRLRTESKVWPRILLSFSRPLRGHNKIRLTKTPCDPPFRPHGYNESHIPCKNQLLDPCFDFPKAAETRF